MQLLSEDAAAHPEMFAAVPCIRDKLLAFIDLSGLISQRYDRLCSPNIKSPDIHTLLLLQEHPGVLHLIVWHSGSPS